MDARTNTEEHLDHLKFEFPDMQGEERLRELILYITRRCEKDESLGATKLNKILYFADFYSYAKYGRPITGLAYQKLPKGPAPVAFLPVRRKMLENHEVVLRIEDHIDYVLHRLIPLREPDLSLFSGEDIALVDFVIQQFNGETAARVSEMSHGRAWRAARMNEKIPYSAVFISNRRATEEDRERARDVIREIQAYKQQHGQA